MTKVLVVGLGLIGGAYAYRLTQKGYAVYGCDKNLLAIEYAKKNKYIIDGTISAKDFIKTADIIILAIYPQAILSFLEENNSLFSNAQVITDVCGVKSSFLLKAVSIAKPAMYCSHHPMAGREKIGIEYARECVFEGANYLITCYENTSIKAIETIEKLGKDLGFAKITRIDPDRHDKMIGFTSQLTHAIAVSLVNSDHDPDTKNYIGDSYRDLTRIAMINDALWSELFLENKEYLLEHIRFFEEELDILKKALENSDKEALQKLFLSSTKIRKEMEK